ncbi:glyoxalase family protein, partial [Vibrio cholerae O1 str. 116059]|jgi:U3 small nucleolar RNA-associated protein 13
MLKVV